MREGVNALSFPSGVYEVMKDGVDILGLALQGGTVKTRLCFPGGCLEGSEI
jgi:hypothetical protein